MNHPLHKRITVTTDERGNTLVWAPRVDLDALYANRPDTRPKMRWPVVDSAFRVIEWHGDYYAALDACKASNDRFIGEPVRDLGNGRHGVEL